MSNENKEELKPCQHSYLHARVTQSGQCEFCLSEANKEEIRSSVGGGK